MSSCIHYQKRNMPDLTFPDPSQTQPYTCNMIWHVAVYGPECKNTPGAHAYRGQLSTTVSGLTCQAWNSGTPHASNWANAVYYPDTTLEDAQNFCRNPDVDYLDASWCYTMDPNTRWENCDIATCNGSGKCGLDSILSFPFLFFPSIFRRYMFCWMK